MKQMMRRAAAAGLALVLAVGPAALASEAMGNEIVGSRTGVSPATELTKQVFWSDTYSDLRTEHYVTYSPNADVRAAVAYGDKILTRATLSSMAQSLEAQGQRVVTGVNGDYYVLSTGAPLGLVMTDGVVRSAASLSSSYRYAVGFQEDGSAFIGKPVITVTATFLGQTLSVGGGINRVRTEKDGYVLLNSDFSATTQNTSPGVDVILTPVLDNLGQQVDVDLQVAGSGDGQDLPPDGGDDVAPPPEAGEVPSDSSEIDVAPETGAEVAPGTEIQSRQVVSSELTVGGRMTCVVEQVLESTGSIAIPEGKLVLSVNANADEGLVAQLRALKAGDAVDIDVTSNDSRWAECDQAIGAMYKLITGGTVQKPEDATASKAWAERTARTARGIKAAGSLVLYTVDGKQPGYSIGATLTQVAMRLKELGCVEAVSLDGGGSTTLGATLPAGSSMAVQGKPSDGSERKNSTAIFLTTSLKPTGVPHHLLVTPAESLLLSGASQQMSAAAVDTSYYQMDYAGPVSYSIQNGDGIVTADGLFTAGGTAGTTQVTATFNGISGTAELSVIKVPDTITLSNEATGAAVTTLSLNPGQQIDLKANATYRGLAVVSQDTCYTWSADPVVGTVDENGLFTATTGSGSGKITVSVGSRTATVNVNVAGHVLPLEDFEDGVSAFTDSASASIAAESAMDYVRFGLHSAKLTYDATAGTATLAAALPITPGERYVSLWVYGDGSGNVLTASTADQSAQANDVVLTALDFTGWKRASVLLPENTASITALNVVFSGAEGRQTGSIWLDQLTTSNEDLNDATAPTVSVKVEGGQLTATVADNVDKSFDAGQVSLTYDGKPVAGAWDPATSTMKATLPAADGKAHRATVTAVDASGNIGRASADIAPSADAASVFVDTADHWAAPYAEFLYSQGITNGVGEPDALEFAPNKNITRGEFFAMAARWMGLDLTQYAAVELPFADAGEIPSWFQNEVKAMYSLGILKGSDSGNGVLRVNANATISRAEAMTILGRTQAKGYAAPALTFADAADVPAWASGYVQSLVGQGGVGGYENRISPNASITRGEVAKMLYAML